MNKEWKQPPGDYPDKKYLALLEGERRPIFVKWNSVYDCWVKASGGLLSKEIQQVWQTGEEVI